MKILVIGSKGFIGSFCIALLSKDNEVWGCDIVNDYVSPRYFQIDTTNSDFKEVFISAQFDACINCSGAASVPDSFVHPVKDFSLNTLNVMRMLEAIRTHQPKCKFINLSSAAVYGNPVQLPVKETAALAPLSPYGFHKKQAEEIVLEYARFFDLTTCSVRLFSVYGPGLCKQLFWDLHTKVMQSDHISLWGTGNESRDFIYVEDVVSALKCVIQNASFDGECINIANGKESSIFEVASIFQKHHYKSFQFTFGGQQRSGDPINWKADITLLSQMGYKPQINLEQGISNYITWLAKEKK